MRVRAKLTIRNDEAMRLREELGLTQKQLADASGVSVGIVQSIESLKFDAVSAKRLLMVAAFLGVEPSTLVPDELRGQRLAAGQTIVREIPVTALLASQQPMLLEDKDAPMIAEEMTAAINTAMNKLTFRQREIVRLSMGMDGHGEHTLAEIGRIFQLHPARVLQIRNAAIRKMQHPAIAGPILDVRDGR